MSFDLLLTEEAVCLDKAPGDPEAKVVACGSSEAAYQMVAKGAPISAADAARFGIKTKKAELANYTLKLDGSTIAITPEDKAYAATLPQPGLQLARAEQIRTSAALSVASLNTVASAASADAAAEAKKDTDEADEKLKTSLYVPAAPVVKAPRKRKPK